MKNKYTRLKWLAAIILAIALYFLVIPLQAAPLNTSSLYILQQEVRGVVTDQAGIPLPGVTVTIKGKNGGTVTDIDGNYSIIIEPDDILVFSFIGFKTLEEAVLGRREINIPLEEDVSQLGEIQINAGYYNTTKRESTGNISRVTAEDIELQPVIGPLQALQGRMAGVEIISNSDQPGMASQIRIRGRNSLREEGNFPLYIIDGVPVNSTPIESNTLLSGTGIDPLNNLNPSNIQSIEILKDADATAIYGSRGANGVVLITTKKGINQRTGLEARVYSGTATVPNRIDLLNTQQYLQIRQRAFENDNVVPDQFNAYDLVLWDQNRYTNWQDFFFGGTSSITNVNLAAAGGSEKTSYRIGGSFHNQGTVYPGDSQYNKLTTSLSLNHRSQDDKWILNFSANYGVDNNELFGISNSLFQAFSLPPNAPVVFNEDGTLHWADWTAAGQVNPLEGFFNTSKIEANSLFTSLGVSYQLYKGLSVRTNLGYTYTRNGEVLKWPKKSYDPANWENIEHSSFHLQTTRKSWIIEPQIDYNTQIGKGKFNALFGGTFQESENLSLGLRGVGFVSEALLGNLNAAENVYTQNHQNLLYRYAAIFARLGFNWDQKYLLSLTARRDGSSRFGANKLFANFGAIGGAWNFSEEPLFKNNVPFFTFGKLRSSYGTTGNDQIGDYGYFDAYEATPGPGGLYPTQLSNSDYSWEENKKLEAAIELGFFKDRINLGLSWYRNRSSNQLVGYALPAITGFNSVQANLPATVENTGWELEMSTLNFQSKNLHWTTSFNITIPKNNLVSYPGLDQSSYATVYKVGHPLNISFLYQYDGIDPGTGLYTIADINEDGRFDYHDRVIIQDNGRKFFGGLNNNITYGNFSLQFFWEFVKQEGTMSLFNAGERYSQHQDVLQALQEGNRYQVISQSFEASTAYYDVLDTTFPVEDASFLRLKTVSLAYSLGAPLLKPLGLASAKLFLHGQNLWTLTKYRGIDPELPNGGTQLSGLRTVTGGIQLNF